MQYNKSLPEFYLDDIDQINIDEGWKPLVPSEYTDDDIITTVITDRRFTPIINEKQREALKRNNVKVITNYLNGVVVEGKYGDIIETCNECHVMNPLRIYVEEDYNESLTENNISNEVTDGWHAPDPDDYTMFITIDTGDGSDYLRYIGYDSDEAYDAVDSVYPDWIKYGLGGGDTEPVAYAYIGDNKAAFDKAIKDWELFIKNNEDNKYYPDLSFIDWDEDLIELYRYDGDEDYDEEDYDESLTENKKKKKPYSSMSITTGDIDYNIRQFNKRMGTNFPGNDNNNPSTEEAKSSSLNSSEVSSTATNEQIILDKNKKLNEAKRYVRRYYIRPQNVFCSNKNDILQRLIEFEDQNCSVYTLNNLGDTKDVTKLTNKDIIYYYDDGILYDKNRMKLMDYDLYIKHEENRPKIDLDTASDTTIQKVYPDRLIGTDDKVLEDLNDINNSDRKYMLYCHTNKINGKKYFGITTQKDYSRWRSGKGYMNQLDFYKAIQKYGWENFDHEIIKDNLSEADAKKLEQEYILKFHTYVNDPQSNGYNASIGGGANLKYYTEEERKAAAKASHERSKKLNGTKWAENARKRYADNKEFYRLKNKLNYEKHKDAFLANEKDYQASLKAKLDIIRQLNTQFPGRLSDEDKQNIINFRNCRNGKYIQTLLNYFSPEEIDAVSHITDEAFNLHFDSVNAYGEVLKESKTTNYTIRDIERCANNIAKAKGYKLCNHDDIWEVVEFTDRGTVLVAMCDNDAENDYECTHCPEMSVDEFWSYLEEPLTEAKTNICCICGEEIDGYGNNPEPYKLAKHGERCCDSCNMKFVIPMRLEQMQDELED